MGEQRIVKIAGLAAVLLLIGLSALASPSAAQSLTDRLKSLFGGKPDEPAQPPQPPPAVSTGPVSEENCPPVTIRAGASTYAVAAAGKSPVGNDVRFQATITKTARDCTKANGEITARIGIQGRVIAGPAGAPSDVEVPLRIAVVQGGVTEKVIATKAYKTTVEMGEGENVPFTFVADDLVYPIPPGAVGDSYIFYIGFDPQLVASESKPKPVKKKK